MTAIFSAREFEWEHSNLLQCLNFRHPHVLTIIGTTQVQGVPCVVEARPAPPPPSPRPRPPQRPSLRAWAAQGPCPARLA